MAKPISFTKRDLEKKKQEKRLAKQQKKEEKKNSRYLRREFSYSKFQQTMILPNDVEKDKITAQVEDGVLTVDIPKRNEEATKIQKCIEVK